MKLPSSLLRSLKNHAGEAKKKRNSLEIISEMLELAKGGPRKTTLMYKVNLSYGLLTVYLSFLLESKLLDAGLDGRFFVTHKGLEFLKEFSEFTELESNYIQKAELLNKLITEGSEKESPAKVQRKDRTHPFILIEDVNSPTST